MFTARMVMVFIMEMIELPIPTLVLQHPQEPSRKDNAVSSVKIMKEQIVPFHVAVGLSWKNLTHALKGFDALPPEPDYLKPAHWVTLYLGTKTQSQHDNTLTQSSGIYFLDKKGNLKEPSETPIHGIILLDGTWAQAKTMWWRNAWLLKTQRIFLVPKEKSKYGTIRKEPRPECVSTLEAAAECYSFFGFDPNAETTLKAEFQKLLLTEKKK